jgi:type IV pilus assembly protein PilC
MPQFSYRLRDREGKIIEEGVVEGTNEEEVTTLLQKRGFLITNLTQKLVKPEGEKPKIRGQGFRRRITQGDLVLFARQLSTLLGASIALLRSLEVIDSQTESRRLHQILTEIKKDVEGGMTFHDALAKHPKVFSEFWVNLIETGEASGQLALPLKQIADYLEATRAFQEKLISALIYPVILSTVAIIALLVFTFKIIPIFVNIFTSFNVELPLLTKAIIGLSNMMRRWFFYGIILLFVLVYLMRRFIRTDEGRRRFDQFKLHLPLVGTLSRNIAIFRFCSSMNMLLKSGVPILIVLEVARKAVGNKIMEEALEKAKADIRDGKSMAESLGKSAIFTPMVVQMVGIGEEVGEVDQMLEKVSKFYEERVTTAVARFAMLFEPITLVFMGLVIGILVLSMFLPIFKLVTIARTAG